MNEDGLNDIDDDDLNDGNIERVILEDGRYRMEAFGFLHEGLGRAVREIYGEDDMPGGHVTGQQLCEGLRDLALERWGLMAPAVLRSWGIHASVDFGNMVYLLIQHGFMRKTEEDSVEDFRNVFDLNNDFDITDRIRLQQ